MIDLHVHSTASDGLLDPPALVAHLAAAGITTFSLTDHDTVARTAAAAAEAGARGLAFMPGIEVTSVHAGRDVHLLGYGVDPESRSLAAFLDAQRAHRVARVQAIAAKLEAAGCPVDVIPIVQTAARQHGRAIGRPHLARALVESGHASSVQDAFDRWLAHGRPAFVPRTGVPPREAIAAVHASGGVCAMAHPAVTNQDDIIPSLAEAGLDAIEVWHSDHDDAATGRYLSLASELGLLVTGGSDFHGPDAGRVCRIGQVGLPADHLVRLMERIARCPASS